jgi:hypothetical protein
MLTEPLSSIPLVLTSSELELEVSHVRTYNAVKSIGGVAVNVHVPCVSTLFSTHIIRFAIQIAIHNFRDWCCHLIKPNFGSTDHNYPRNKLFPRVCTLPSASAISKCILEIVFCRCSAPPAILPRWPHCAKWRPFSFIFIRGNRKVGWAENCSHIAFW